MAEHEGLQINAEYKELWPVINFHLCGEVVFSQRSHFIPRERDLVRIVMTSYNEKHEEQYKVYQNMRVKKVEMIYGFTEGRGDQEVYANVYLERGQFLLPNTSESTGYDVPDTMTNEWRHSGVLNDSLHSQDQE